MRQVVIENPVLNSPFVEPSRHFKFDEDGITNEIVEERRCSSYFIPIPPPKKRGKQLQFETEWTQDRIEENKLVNQIRERVGQWRAGGYYGITSTTSRLLEYWRNPERENKLFFCQIEALETAIYIAEAAAKCGDAWIENRLREANDAATPGLPRLALKMATGSGKTVVMAMLIAWQTLNKLANPQDARYSDTFLVITPGITIRDRLRVLLPSDPNNYYRERDILTPEQLQQLGQAKIVITNFHAFKPRERVKAGRLTKAILGRGDGNVFTETPDEMVRRVCRELGTKKNIIVVNDEAHHCYRRKPDADKEKMSSDERSEAEKREEAARIWISGIEAVKAKIGVKRIYDLSATPFFLRGSGYPEGTLFPWVVSDFSLVDAIESGIVKVPRVPVADDSMTGDAPTYRALWLRIRENLPRKGRKKAHLTEEPQLPVELQGALHSLYDNYTKYYRLWEKNTEAQAKGVTPPVFIVVCNNTSVSKLVYDYIAGWEKQIGDRGVVQAGALPIFRNDDGDGNWLDRPSTVLVDSEQLESGEAMSDEFKKVAKQEIERFKQEIRERFPGRDVEKLTNEDLLREVMNTVGKTGKLGEHVKCVVSVSMLTEGWDANTVTHILGVRAFGTQLLCEQVVGRGLRRQSYAPNEHDMFEPEYAEVYGVPFSFIPCSGSTAEIKPGPEATHVRALEERIACEITFPRVTGYRYEVSDAKLTAEFTADSQLALSTQDIPTKTENAPIVGESVIHTLDDLKSRRLNEVAFLLAKLTVEKYFRHDGEPRSEQTKEHRFDSAVQTWRFPEVLAIAKRWLDECVTCKGNTFKQLLLLVEFAHDAADVGYFHYDGQGNVVAVSDEAREAVAYYEYDAWGNVLTSCGDYANEFAFSTKQASTGTGLIDFGYRWYDPKVGRWTQRDPVNSHSGVTLYGFVDSSPPNLVDPWGLLSKEAHKEIQDFIDNTLTPKYQSGTVTLGAGFAQLAQKIAQLVSEEVGLFGTDKSWGGVNIQIPICEFLRVLFSYTAAPYNQFYNTLKCKEAKLVEDKSGKKHADILGYTPPQWLTEHQGDGGPESGFVSFEDPVHGDTGGRKDHFMSNCVVTAVGGVFGQLAARFSEKYDQKEGSRNDLYFNRMGRQFGRDLLKGRVQPNEVADWIGEHLLNQN